MRYLQYGQIKTTNRQFQTFRDLKSERSDKSRIGNTIMFYTYLIVYKQLPHKKERNR